MFPKICFVLLASRGQNEEHLGQRVALEDHWIDTIGPSISFPGTVDVLVPLPQYLFTNLFIKVLGCSRRGHDDPFKCTQIPSSPRTWN